MNKQSENFSRDRKYKKVPNRNQALKNTITELESSLEVIKNRHSIRREKEKKKTRVRIALGSYGGKSCGQIFTL